MSEQEPVLEQCDYMHLHEKVIEQVQEEMPEEEILYDLAELFKVFGDSTRIKILYVLFQSEMCVCGIAQLLNKTVFYSLADAHVNTILNQGLEHIEE